MNKGIVLFVAVLIGIAIGGISAYLFPGVEARREERFLDECEWGPRTGVQADGTPAPRKPNLSFPVCYQELVKARTVQTIVTLGTAPAAPPAKTETVPPKK